MNLKIKQALTSLICALVIAILFQGVLGVNQLRSVNENALDLSNNWLPSVRELGELKYKITRLRLVDARFVTALESVSDLVKIADQRLEDANKNAVRYEGLISSAEEKALWIAYKQEWHAYLGYRTKLIAATQAKDQAAVSSLF